MLFDQLPWVMHSYRLCKVIGKNDLSVILLWIRTLHNYKRWFK